MKCFKGQKKSADRRIFLQTPSTATKGLCNQKLSLQKSQCDDISFIKKYHSPKACPDFNGFNEEQLGKVGVPLKPNSWLIYQSLIDKTPSVPSIIFTAMYKAERITQKNWTLFTLDQYWM